MAEKKLDCSVRNVSMRDDVPLELDTYRKTTPAFEWSKKIANAESLEEYMRKKESDTIHHLAAAALRVGSISRLSSNADKRLDAHDMTHRCHEVPAIDQEDTGTCWLQAGTALLATMAHRSGLTLRLSVPFLAFFDKLNKALVFLRRLQTAKKEMKEMKEKKMKEKKMKEETDEIDHAWWDNQHVLRSHFAAPIDDGGTWNMFVYLVMTYGVVPHDSMPPTHQTSHTNHLNMLLNDLLRGQLLKEDTEGEVMDQVLCALKRTFATPPCAVVLTKAVHGVDGTYSPKGLLELVIKGGSFLPWVFRTLHRPVSLDGFCVLTNAPDRDNGGYIGPTTNNPGNMEQDVFYAVDENHLIKSCVKALKDGIPVWFSCDVKLNFSTERGIAAKDLTVKNTEALLGVTLDDDKRNRMLCRNTAPVHAMLFTAVKLVDGKPVRWRIKNSWGTDFEGDGYLTVDHDWFSDNVFQVAVPETPPYKESKEKFLRLEPWDIFGTVAHPRLF